MPPELVANEGLQNLLGDVEYVCGRVGVTSHQQRLLMVLLRLSRSIYRAEDPGSADQGNGSSVMQQILGTRHYFTLTSSVTCYIV